MGVMSSEDEDALFSSDKEGELKCSFAHHACSPLLQGFLHEEELCDVALTCHLALDVISLSRLNTGAFLCLKLDLWCVDRFMRLEARSQLLVGPCALAQGQG